MRVCIDRRKGIMVSAWPRSIYQKNAALGGQAAARSRASRHGDVAEVRAYLASKPKATVHDTAMCCFLGDKTAKRIMEEIRNGKCL